MSTVTSNRIVARLRALRHRDEDPQSGGERGLAARVAALEAAVEESRQLNQRLADVVDVVVEVLVPAVDRDDDRLRTALANLGKTLDT
ncbi:MAG: DUF6752 domain-containing protein [Nocardioidaceae bacterium]